MQVLKVMYAADLRPARAALTGTSASRGKAHRSSIGHGIRQVAGTPPNDHPVTALQTLAVCRVPSRPDLPG